MFTVNQTGTNYYHFVSFLLVIMKGLEQLSGKKVSAPKGSIQKSFSFTVIHLKPSYPGSASRAWCKNYLLYKIRGYRVVTVVLYQAHGLLDENTRNKMVHKATRQGRQICMASFY